MKNKLLSTSLLTFLLTASVLLGFTSRVSADTAINYNFSTSINGAQTYYDVPLYASATMMDKNYNTYDVAIPGVYNEIDITINSTPSLASHFTVPTISSDHSSCSWSFDATAWSLNVLTGSNLVNYTGYFQDVSFAGTIFAQQTFLIKYQVVGTGPVTMRVYSPGTQGDGSDSTAYTINLNVYDNSSKTQ